MKSSCSYYDFGRCSSTARNRCEMYVFLGLFSQKTHSGKVLQVTDSDSGCIDFKTISFTGKETDCETGFSYFGARYYDPTLLTSFLSIDRYADKYPSLSPYHYCAWNPIKLIDPSGDTIFNAYEKYKDIKGQVDELTKTLETTRNIFNKIRIKSEINTLKSKNEKYNKVQGAIDAFKKANPEEYDIFDSKLTSHGNKVNITIYASDKFTADGGQWGKTLPSLLKDQDTKEIVGVSSIKIILYGVAFVGGNNGLSTLANEFGDVLFGIARPQDQYDGYKQIQQSPDYYWRDLSSRFSFEYENYIMDPVQYKKPDPITFK